MAGLCASTATDDDPWTATSLLSAFSELAIACLFLAGATITYLTSKFIKISGLHLPCFDRGGEWIERQSEVRRHAFYNRLSLISDCFLHRIFIEERRACDQSSSSTTGSEQGWNSLEPMGLNQLSFHCKSHNPQRRCHCVWHPYSDELKTGISDEATASRSQTQRRNDDFLLNGHLFGCKFSCQRRFHKHSGKKMLGSFSPADRVSDDDGIRGAEEEGTLLELKHSLKVFPEECIDYNALIQGHKRNGVMGHPRALGKFGDLSLRAEPKQPLELSLHQSPFEPENVRDKFEGFSEGCAYICGGALPAEPVRDVVEEECACAILNSSDFRGREQKIEQMSEDAGEFVGNNLSDHDEKLEISGSVITDDGRPKGSTCQSDDDTLELKKELAAEREVLDRTYLELEKERNASASAADEAMGLITRLQEDKATLQMEAVQYQRIAEERAMFDSDAIVALRDILLKREAEKVALEKEIELYRRKLLVDELEAAEQRTEQDKVTDDFISKGGNEEFMLEYSKTKKVLHGERSMSAVGAILENVSCARGEWNAEFTTENFSRLSDGSDLLKPFEFIIEDDSSPEEGIARQHGDIANHNPGDCSPETVEDAYYEDQIDDLDAFRQVQSSAPTVALSSFRNQSEGTKIKFESSAEIQWQHVLSRIWKLEDQISSLRTKYGITQEQPLSSQFNTVNTEDIVQLGLSKETRETPGCQNFKHYNSAAKQSASGKHSGVRDPGRRIMRGKSEAYTSPSIPKRFITCDNMHANRTLSCEMDPTSNYCGSLELLEDSLMGNAICSEMGDRLRTPDPFFGGVVTSEEAQVQEKKPSETASSSFCLSLEEETGLADEKGGAIDDGVNEISIYSSPGDFSHSQTSSIIMGDRYRNISREEMKKIMYRLQMVEADRGLMRQAIDSIRKEMEGMKLLLDTAQQLRLLLASEGMVRASENPQQLDDVLVDSASEAEKSPPQRHHSFGKK